MSIEEYTEFLVKSICKEEDMIKVCSLGDEKKIINIAVPETSMKVILGKDGKNIKAIRTLVNVYAYKKNMEHVEINIDTF